MGENLMSLMQTVKVIDVVFTMAIFIIIASLILTQWKKIHGWLEQWKTKQNFMDETNESIAFLKQRDKEMDDKMSNIMISLENFEQAINNTQKLLLNKIEQDNETNRSKLKSDIEKIYMLHKDSKEITTYQFESLKGLIEAYESHGGENSFVHSVVEVEMYTWKVIDLKKEMDNDIII